jgi:hypothetical protein
MGYTFRFCSAGGVDAVESEFGDGRKAPSMRCSTVTAWSSAAAGRAIARAARRCRRAPCPIVSFMHYDLGYFDLEQKTLQPLDNPFGTRLSPMS